MIAFIVAYMIIGVFYPLKGRKEKYRKTILSVFSLMVIIAGLLMAWGYISAYSVYVVVINKRVENDIVPLRIVIGSEIRKSVNRQGRTDQELLMDNLLMPDKVWTPNSLRSARLQLFLRFIIAFFLLTLGSALFAPLTYRETAGI
jgi:hypothetical protein